MKTERKSFYLVCFLMTLAMICLLACEVMEAGDDDDDDDNDDNNAGDDDDASPGDDDDESPEAVCGDLFVGEGEQCEEGVITPGCKDDEECVECQCVKNPVCGDGIVTGPTEDCEEQSDCEEGEICLDCVCEEIPDYDFPVSSTGGTYNPGTAPSPTGSAPAMDYLSFEQITTLPGDCPTFEPWTAVCANPGDPFRSYVDYLVAKAAEKGEWAGAVYVTADGYDGYLEITDFYDELQFTPTLFQVISDMAITADTETGDYTLNFALSPADENGDPDPSQVTEYISGPLYVR